MFGAGIIRKRMTARLERGHCADYEPTPTTAWRGRRMARRVVAVHTSCAQFFLPAGGLFSRLTAECCQYLVPLSSEGQGGANDFQHAATHRHPCYLTSLPQPTRLFFHQTHAPSVSSRCFLLTDGIHGRFCCWRSPRPRRGRSCCSGVQVLQLRVQGRTPL